MDRVLLDDRQCRAERIPRDRDPFSWGDWNRIGQFAASLTAHPDCGTSVQNFGPMSRVDSPSVTPL